MNNRAAPPQSVERPQSRLPVSRPKKAGHRTVIYATGGSGKTTLAGYMPGVSAWFDFDKSLGALPLLRDAMVVDAPTYAASKALLEDYGAWDGIQNILIDSGTRWEELAQDYVVETVPDKVSGKVNAYHEYNYGHGQQALHLEFCRLLPVLDRHSSLGRNIVIVCHEMKIEQTNILGADSVCAAPALLHARRATQPVSTMERVFNWADNVFYIRQEYQVSKEGKAKDKSQRVIYTSEFPGAFKAKSRYIADKALPYTLDEPTLLWDKLQEAIQQ